ncbi:hypothetical protein FRX31_033306, partial [Thalictrum thalictroides]
VLVDMTKTKKLILYLVIDRSSKRCGEVQIHRVTEMVMHLCEARSAVTHEVTIDVASPEAGVIQKVVRMAWFLVQFLYHVF